MHIYIYLCMYVCIYIYVVDNSICMIMYVFRYMLIDKLVTIYTHFEEMHVMCQCPIGLYAVV